MVAKDSNTGERLWYLVGVQADVTEIDVISQDHFSVLQEMSMMIREQLKLSLMKMAAEAAVEFEQEVSSPVVRDSYDSQRKFELFKEPVWMTGNEGIGAESGGKLRATIPPGAGPEVLKPKNGAMPHRDEQIRAFVEAYEKESMSANPARWPILRKWPYIDEWKTWLRLN